MLGTMGKILNGWIWDPQGSTIPMDPQESTIPMDPQESTIPMDLYSISRINLITSLVPLNEDAIFYNIYTHLT